MTDFYDDPAFVSDLMAFSTELAIAFARAQRDAGVDLMGVGGRGVLARRRLAVHQDDPSPSCPAGRSAQRPWGRGRARISAATPTRICAARASIGYDILDIDSQVPMEAARSKMGPTSAVILGNIPTVEVMQQGAPGVVWATAAECYRLQRSQAPRSPPDAKCRAARRSKT